MIRSAACPRSGERGNFFIRVLRGVLSHREEKGTTNYSNSTNDRTLGTVCVLSSGLVTDAGLAHLAGLNQLHYLQLDRAPVSDSGLPHLGRLTNLQWLTLNGTQVTDVGLIHLQRLPRLQQLDLDDTQVTDAGLVELQGFAQLHDVSLCGTRVSDGGNRLAPCRGFAVGFSPQRLKLDNFGDCRFVTTSPGQR